MPSSASLVDHPRRAPGCTQVFTRFRILNAGGQELSCVPLGGDAIFELSGHIEERLSGVTFAMRIDTLSGLRATTCHTLYQFPDRITIDGAFTVSCAFRNLRLMPGPYNLSLVAKVDDRLIDQIDNLPIEVVPTDVYRTGKSLPPRTGVYIPDASWSVQTGA